MTVLTVTGQAITDAILRAGSVTFPTDGVWVSLHTADPTDDGSAAEFTAASYARCEAAAAVWDASVDGVCALNTELVFATAAEDWGIATHAALWDDATAGNAWFYGPLAAARTILTGSTFHIPAGSLTAGIS